MHASTDRGAGTDQLLAHAVQEQGVRVVDEEHGRPREGGADERDIMAAIAVGKMVRAGATGKMDDFISEMFKDFEQCEATVASPCGCS